MAGLSRTSRRFHPELTALRRDLHAHPELGFEEVYTAGRVREALKLCGVDEMHTGIGKTGVVGVIKGRAQRAAARMVGLRADMDALHDDRKQNEFAGKSTKAGMMHGCGHDGHTTMLVGAARYLAETRNFDGTAVLIFQPGEEGFAGAKAMIDDGLFERFPVEAVYAHAQLARACQPGTIGINPGPMMAAADRVTIDHRARAATARIPTSRSIRCWSPRTSSRRRRASSRATCGRSTPPSSACARCKRGDLHAMSVIPGKATLVGTVRTFSPEVQDMIEQRLSELCSVDRAAASAPRAACITSASIPPPSTRTREALFAGDVAESLVGADNVVRDLEPSMGAEDFSFMLQAKPGAYMRIGQGGEGSCFLHNSALRLQRRHPSARLGAARQPGRAVAAACRGLNRTLFRHPPSRS